MYDVYFQNEKRASNMPYAEDAAMLVSCLGDGSDVRIGRRVVWTEGAEEQSAGASFDEAAETMRMRAKRAGVAS